jgi:hypothetical protein
VEFKFFLSSSIVPALIKEKGRVAQVAHVWKGQFGQKFQGLDSVRYAKNQVELALVDVNKSSGEKLKVFTVADQYIKKARPSQVAVSALASECVQFLTENFGGDYVLRECLPCEHHIAGKQWSILAKDNFYLGAVGASNGAGVAKAWCSFSLEALFIHYVVSVIRQDVTRSHVWMDGKFAPWEVIVVGGENDDVTKRYLSMLQQAGFTCRAGLTDRGSGSAVFADELGALALIAIEPGETSVYSTKCVVRDRDRQGEKKCTYLEVVPTLMEIKSRCN